MSQPTCIMKVTHRGPTCSDFTWQHTHTSEVHPLYIHFYSAISASQMLVARFRSQVDFKSNVTSVEPHQYERKIRHKWPCIKYKQVVPLWRKNKIEWLYIFLETVVIGMWDVKTKMIPVIIGVNGTISKSFRKYVSNVPGKHEVKELQKTAILFPAHILRKVLM